ncbi:MAG: UV DNA damage repair endonuclease UvsE [Candidatus Faecisoma sp.]|nr:UV DNA damage repair endonuclease UvsE [Acholeplasma sp.]MDY2892264.1 UV DNA damage repair endonuclease UvsE [Candidatus Faecisoma sp.]
MINLGYVSIATCLDVTTSTTLTYTEFCKNKDYNKLDSIIKSNLEALSNIIDYNIKNNIHFYRLTSKLIPLATKVKFDYIKKYKKYYDEIGKKIEKNNIRIDVHPDQFCVLNSTKKEVLDNSFEILKYHYNILEALHIKNKIIVLHVGSSVFGKTNSIKRFINNFNKLPIYIQKCIAIENDDKIYNVDDCLDLCNKLNIPFILDYHHHICNHINMNIDYEKILKTWTIKPKMHFSSPKNKTKKDFRSHHDYIEPLDFINFINTLPFDVDIMLEAKAKDEALFRLTRQLKYYDFKFLDETSFERKVNHNK